MPEVLTPDAQLPTAGSLKKFSYRIDSIDLLRGLVMIIMALDHTRDFFHKTAWTQDPLDLSTTTPILFFTRWITHLCAPIFVFLSGAGAYFQSKRKSKKDLSIFLIKRGLWLILVEIIVLTFLFSFDVYYRLFVFQVIWSIGISMVILGLMTWLPFPVILCTGLVIVLGHNALDFFEKNNPSPGWWYSLLHQPGNFSLWPGHRLFIFYPFLPWTGLMLLGFCFGKLFLSYEGRERRRMLTWLGLGVLAFFIVLRATNIYGNPFTWSVQKTPFLSFLDFMKVQKYPPSLLYMCATVGVGILFLAFAGNKKNKLTKIITVYGRVPFLYYILHFFLVHLVASVFFLARGHSFAEGLESRQGGFVPQFLIPGEGVSLLAVYAIWICIVAALYPVCKWFSEYKQANPGKWWLSYL